MKIEKKVIANLNKCYSIAPLTYHGEEHILVAAEKQDPCYLFDLTGRLVDKVWDGPGGIMTMVQVPNTNGQFLSTYKFYSPNDSKEAKIVTATPVAGQGWEIRTLVDLPHVHRFDILRRNGKSYLIACTLKSGHQYQDDWSQPGKVYGAELPPDLSIYNDENQLELTVLKDDMLKNHGYSRNLRNGIETAIVSSNEGVFRFVPPEQGGGKWQIETLLKNPVSDSVLVDLDGDGKAELCVFAPFHGEVISIYREVAGSYQEVYRFSEPAEFTHAIYGGDLCGQPSLVVGHRRGKRNLMIIRYYKERGCYDFEIIDEDCGSANVFHYVKDDKDVLISANREIDEVAMYTFAE